jgi:DNA-3-methyladenine glycosylase
MRLDRRPFELHARTDEPELVVGPRIGITKAAELPLRFSVRGSRYVSAKRMD